MTAIARLAAQDAQASAPPRARSPERTDAPPEIVLDLSRLLSRMLHPTPTGVDRVEMAYAQHLLRLAPERLSFAATHPAGLHGRLPTAAVRAFLEATADRWETEGQVEAGRAAWRRALGAGVRLLPGRPAARPAGRRRVYLHLSARSLERTPLFQAVLRREQARLVAFVHDLIPLDYPEYARPKGPALYRRKIATVTALASGVIVNSWATAMALGPYATAAGRSLAVHVAPLGADVAHAAGARAAPPGQARPYFVALGTIEPRKNHLLLLTIWRRLVERLGPDRTPRLVLVGRRGWENENILDLLDRCPALKGVVEEQARLSDAAMRTVLGGARALLFPSFAEGYGLPLVEALALGVPVLASDLPALREAGGETPDYLDPLDGPAWIRAILDHARPDSPLRARQLESLARWQAPTWDAHVRSALAFIDGIAG
jgi:glycosyltransferase involved in cell wall biosynthesis